MFFLFLSIALLLAALAAAIFAWHGESSIIAIRETATLSVAEVVARHRARQLGQLVEVVGTIECDAPLRAPDSETLCVAYDYTVSNEMHQTRYRGAFGPEHRDNPFSAGRTHHTVNHSFDQHDHRVPRFYVRDASGRIAVDTAGAEIDLLETVARFESYSGDEANIERQIWRQEHALPLGNRVYVLASLADDGGEPVLMRHPVERGRRFIISHRDERTLLNHTRLRSYGLYLFSGLALGGALLTAALALQ